MKQNRIEYIDIIKGITIFLVVLGHATLCNNTLRQWIYSFHMPVFFAVYGMTYDAERHSGRGFLSMSFIIQKLKRLILPAIIWAAGYAFVSCVIKRSFSIKNLIFVLYGSQKSLKIAGSLTSIWFLACMFFAVCLMELIMWLLYTRIKDERRRDIFIIALIPVLSGIAYLLPYFNIGYPWCINLAPMAASFMFAGYILRKIINKAKAEGKTKKTTVMLIFVICLVIVTCTFKLNTYNIRGAYINTGGAVYGNYALYMLDSLFGVGMITALAVFMNECGWISPMANIGQNSFAVFLVHKPIVRGICSLSSHLGFSHWVMAFPIAVLSLCISYLLAYIIKRYTPILLGDYHKKKQKECV